MSKLPLWRDIFSSHLPVNLQEMYPTPIEQDGNPAPLGIAEREMTDAQMKKREEIVKSMKDEKDDFERRYPGRGKEVMYATATKMAMEEANGDTDYETYFRDMLKKHGYDSPADIPDDKKDDFFNAVDKGYNATNESLQLDEKNVPTNPELWSRAKAAAKRKFDVYPSAYANGWAAKWYKKRGGSWRTESKEAYNLSDPEQREFGTNSLATIYKSSTPGELRESDDQEMAVAQLHSIASKSIKVRDMLKDVMIDDIPAWIQDKLSVSDHNMSAILDYYTHYESENTDDLNDSVSETPIAESSSSVVEASKDPMVPLRMQAAMVIAKSLGSVKGSGQTADFRVSGGTPESIVNQAVRVWLSGSHTNEGWALGAKMLKLAKSMGIKWDENLLKGKLGPITIKKLGLAEADAETVALRNKHKQQATALKLQQAREKMSLKQRKLQQQAQKAKL